MNHSLSTSVSNNSQFVKSNLLIAAAKSLPVEQSRIIHYALASVNSKQSNPGYIEIVPSEYAKAYSLSRTAAWKNLKADIDALQETPFKIYDKDGSYWSISWLSDYAYLNDGSETGRLKLRFTEGISPFLFELKNNFTVIEMCNTSQLHKTAMALSIYERLVAIAHKDTGIQKGHSGFDEYKMYQQKYSVADLRSIGGYQDSYQVWSRFKDKILDKAIKAINTHSDIIVAMELVKSSRKVTDVIFSFSLNKDKAIRVEPARPRLKPRPRVLEGSNLHGEWVRYNLNLLLAYREQLQNFYKDDIAKLKEGDTDKKRLFEKMYKSHLPIADTRRVIDYSKKLGDKFLQIEFEGYEQEQLLLAENLKVNVAQKN